MKNSKARKGDERNAIAAALRACGPVAKGSLSSVRMKCAKRGCAACRDGKGHPAWIFAYRDGGRRKCLYVRKKDVDAVRDALERGRLVESVLLDEGVAYIRGLREES